MRTCTKLITAFLSAVVLTVSGFAGTTRAQADTLALGVRYNADPYGAAYTTEVENQAQNNYCWAYMADAVLESHLIKTGAVSQADFSESDMISQLSGGSYGFSNLSAGGNYHQAVGYWTRGVQYGPRLEAEGRQTDYYVSETAELGRYDITNDRSKQNYIQNIKNLLVRYGSVGVSVYFNQTGREYMTNNGAYYYPQDQSPGVNHGVTIVGWDDTFSAKSFSNLMTKPGQPEKDGAFLVKNSWGKDDVSSIGRNTGYYWISYENYFQDAFTVTNVVERSKLYDYIYETDYRGLYDYMPGTSYSRLYQLGSRVQQLSGFATYVKAGAYYRFYVNGQELTQFSGTMAQSGYRTFQLLQPMTFAGTALELRVEVSGDDTAVPVAAGEVTAGVPDTGNVCLKVFTRLPTSSSSPAGSVTPGGTTNPGSTVSQVLLYPQECTLRRGANQKFTAQVLGSGQPPQQVNWQVSGSSSLNTRVVDGVLYIGPDETSGQIYLYANASADNSKSAAAKVTIADNSTTTPGGSTQTPGTSTEPSSPQPDPGEDRAPKVGTINKGIYTCQPDLTASYTKCIAKTHFSVTVPATVKVKGKTYEVTSLDSGCMQKNKKIVSVSIGKYVTAIGDDAFRGCSRLKKVKIKSIAVESIGEDAFSGLPSDAVIYVPRSCLSDYRTMIRDSGNKKVPVRAYN